MFSRSSTAPSSSASVSTTTSSSSWLGVSRTPVREAIAKLADQALVDIEANRYTRIVAPTFDEFVDTVETGYDVWSLFVRAGRAQADQGPAQRGRRFSRRAPRHFKAKTPEEVTVLVRINEILLEAANSPSLTRLWGSTGAAVPAADASRLRPPVSTRGPRPQPGRPPPRRRQGGRRREGGRRSSGTSATVLRHVLRRAQARAASTKS